MSYEDAETIIEQFEKRDAKQAKHSLISRMEHKLFHRNNTSNKISKPRNEYGS